jgi:hypothetical protein
MKPVHYAAMALLAVVQWAALPFAQAETEDPMLFYGPIETSFQLTELSTPTPGGQWVVTVIDDGGPNGDNVGEYASLAVPTAGPYAGRSAIGYYNRTRSDLKYAQRVSGWYTCFPDQEPSVDVEGR